jgi:hypothetical protein
VFDSIDKAADKVESAINVAAEAVGKGLVRISHLPHSASLLAHTRLTLSFLPHQTCARCEPWNTRPRGWFTGETFWSAYVCQRYI